MANFLKRQKIISLFLSIVFLLIPLVVTVSIAHFYFHSNLLHTHILWGDEIIYWQEITTFKEVGFSGGYSTYGELISKASFSHFGAHGPVYPVFMGLLSRIFGWSKISGPLYNLAFIFIGMLIYLVLVKPDNRQKIFLCLFFLFFSPILLYLPTTMQESLNQSFGFLIGAFLIVHLSKDPPPAWISVVAVATVLFASLIRITWALALFPLIYLIFQNKGKKRFWLSFAVSLPVILLLGFLYIYWTSAYPFSFLYQVSQINPFTFSSLVSAFWVHFQQNILQWFSFSSGNPLEVFQRYLILFLILGMVLLILKGKRIFSYFLFLLAGETAITVIFYDVSYFRDYRTLAPFIIITILALISELDSSWVRAIALLAILSQFFFIPSFLKLYMDDFHKLRFAVTEDQHYDHKLVEALSDIEYKKSDTIWCNSLLAIADFSPEYLTIPAGIGINYYAKLPQNDPIKSHYILVQTSAVKTLNLPGELHLLYKGDDNSLFEQTADSCLK